MSISKNSVKTGVLSANGGALTSSYVTKGGIITCSGYDQLILFVRWTKGDETSLEYKVQFSDTIDFTNAYERSVLSTDASGISTVLANVFTMATASANVAVPIDVTATYMRVQFKATGGTPTGTIGADYRLDNNER
jgi:hypothetical protein